MTSKLVKQYFSENSKLRDEVWKAIYAYHDPVDLENAHEFPKYIFPDGVDPFYQQLFRESKCIYCGRTREQVRWDELPHTCDPNIEICTEKILFDEEKQYFQLLEKAKIHIPQLLDKMGVSGETLSILHHTYGYDLETSLDFIDSVYHDTLSREYEHFMQLERARSKSKQIKTVIKINE